MSTITYSDGIMAGDKQMSYHKSRVTKVFKLDNGEHKGWLVGLSGDHLSALLQWKDWYNGTKMEPPTEEELGNYHIMVVNTDGDIFLYLNNPYPIPIEDTHFAVGSGSDYAMGALDAGVSAVVAIEIASQRDHGTNNSIDVVKL